MQPAAICLLPAEVLERVLRLLPPRALKAAVLVCRRWQEVGEAPALWAPWVRLRVTMRSLASMPGLLRARRAGAVTHLTMLAASDDLLQAVAAHPGLRVVDMNGLGHMGRFDPSAVCPDLLAAAFSGLEELAMETTALTRRQLEAVLAAVTGYRRLKRLKLRRTKLTSMAPALLVGAISHLEEADLNKTCLTKVQVEAILAAVKTDVGMKLNKLNMGDNGCATLEQDFTEHNLMEWVDKVNIFFLDENIPEEVNSRLPIALTRGAVQGQYRLPLGNIAAF